MCLYYSSYLAHGGGGGAQGEVGGKGGHVNNENPTTDISGAESKNILYY